MGFRRIAGSISGLIHRPPRFQGLGPLSLRCVLILCCLLYLLVGPVNTSSDIVSAGLTYGSLTLITTIVLLVVTQGAILARRVSLEVLPPQDNIVSGTPTRIVLRLPALRVLPLTHLDLSVEFDHPLPTPLVVRLVGASPSDRRVHIDVVFPHRGTWSVQAIRCQLGDIAGMAQYSWRYNQECSIIVAPPVATETDLPILSSAQRPGDLVIDTLNRQGDPFDIKAYHPSDGVKRIVWKAFAKRGELLSRHPEASMTPEGYVVILVLARPSDDDLCSRTLAYVRSLDELKLDVVVGCQGGRDATPARTPDASRSLLIETVWESAHHAPEHLHADAVALLDHCRKTAQGITIGKLLIFCSGDRLNDDVEAQKISNLAAWLASQGITPVFCLTPPSISRAPHARSKQTFLKQWFTIPDPTSTFSHSNEAYHRFLSGCLSKQWEVFV